MARTWHLDLALTAAETEKCATSFTGPVCLWHQTTHLICFKFYLILQTKQLPPYCPIRWILSSSWFVPAGKLTGVGPTNTISGISLRICQAVEVLHLNSDLSTTWHGKTASIWFLRPGPFSKVPAGVFNNVGSLTQESAFCFLKRHTMNNH